MKFGIKMAECSRCGKYLGCWVDSRLWAAKDEIKYRENKLRIALVTLNEHHGRNLIYTIKQLEDRVQLELSIHMITVKKRDVSSFTPHSLPSDIDGTILLHHSQGMPH